jgi:hypothetical protein
MTTRPLPDCRQRPIESQSRPEKHENPATNTDRSAQEQRHPFEAESKGQESRNEFRWVGDRLKAVLRRHCREGPCHLVVGRMSHGARKRSLAPRGRGTSGRLGRRARDICRLRAQRRFCHLYKELETRLYDMNSNFSAPSNEDTSSRGYLDWLTTLTTARQGKEETDWRSMEAERLDEQRPDDLSIEVYGY